MTNRTRKTTMLRQLLKGSRPLWLPAIYDALSAKIFEQAGFEAFHLGGASISHATLGMPDLGLITQTELVMMTRYVSNAVKGPIIVDVDTGYGNVLNARRTLHDVLQAGAAGLHIEDQVTPKRCGHLAGKEVIPLEEVVGKLRGVCELRNELDPDAVIIARTDSRTAVGGGLDEVIRRGNAYLEAGADMIFPDALQSEEELNRCIEEIKGPLFYNMHGLSPVLSLERLRELGVAVVLCGLSMFCAARAMWDYAHDLKARASEAELEFWERGQGHPLGTIPDAMTFLGYPQMREMEKKYLPSLEVVRRFETTIGYMG